MVNFVKYESRDPKLSSCFAADGIAIKLETGPEAFTSSYSTRHSPATWHTQHQRPDEIQHTTYYPAETGNMSDGSE